MFIFSDFYFSVLFVFSDNSFLLFFFQAVISMTAGLFAGWTEATLAPLERVQVIVLLKKS